MQEKVHIDAQYLDKLFPPQDRWEFGTPQHRLTWEEKQTGEFYARIEAYGDLLTELKAEDPFADLDQISLQMHTAHGFKHIGTGQQALRRFVFPIFKCALSRLYLVWKRPVSAAKDCNPPAIIATYMFLSRKRRQEMIADPRPLCVHQNIVSRSKEDGCSPAYSIVMELQNQMCRNIAYQPLISQL